MGKVSVRDVGLNAALMFCSLVFRTGNAGRAEAQPIVEAAPPQAADLLPASTAYFVEVSRPLGLIDSVFEHPLRARIEQLELYQRAMQAPQYLQSRLGLTVLEFTLGMDWRQAIDVLSGEGLYAAFDPATQGFAILAKSPDAQKLLVLRDKLVKLARDDAQRNKRADPFNPVEYRGVTAHDGVGASLTVIGPWLVVSNKTELGRSIVDRYLDRPQVVNAAPQTLTHHPGFAAARSTAGPTALWMFADL